MPHCCTRVAVPFVAVALSVLAVASCGGTKTGPTTADYAGLWVNPESNNVVWLHVTAHGEQATLRWERKWSAPVVQQATLRSDGTLNAPAVATGTDSIDAGSPAYVGRLTADGHLDMSTTTHVQGVNAAIPVTLHFERGSQAEYTVFAARMDKNLAEQAISDDYVRALQTVSEGIALWQNKHGIKVPPVHAVRPGGAIEKVLKAAGKSWPRLSNGKLLVPGHGHGEYVYHPLTHGYRIGGLAPNGQGPRPSAPPGDRVGSALLTPPSSRTRRSRRRTVS